MQEQVTAQKSPVDIEECRSWIKTNAANHADFNITDDRLDEFLQQAEKVLPQEYRKDFFDIAILYSEKDRVEVKRFEDDIYDNVNILEAPHRPSIYTVERKTGDMGAAPVLKILGEVIQRSVYLFLFFTDNLCSDAFTEIATHEALVRTLKDKETMWSIVPCYNAPPDSVEVPFGISCLRGIRINQRDAYTYNNIQMLISQRRSLLHQRQMGQRMRAQEWFKDKVITFIQDERYRSLMLKERFANAMRAPPRQAHPQDTRTSRGATESELPPSATSVKPGTTADGVQIHTHIYVPNITYLPETEINIRGSRNVQIGEGNVFRRTEAEPDRDEAEIRFVLRPQAPGGEGATAHGGQQPSDAAGTPQFFYRQPASGGLEATPNLQNGNQSPLKPDDSEARAESTTSSRYIHAEQSSGELERLKDFSEPLQERRVVVEEPHDLDTPAPDFPDIEGVDDDSEPESPAPAETPAVSSANRVSSADEQATASCNSAGPTSGSKPYLPIFLN